MHEAVIKFNALDEATGKDKVVTQKWLISHALSLHEAFTKFEEEICEEIGEYKVTSVNECNIHECIGETDATECFKCSVAYIEVNENTGREKKIISNCIVWADDIDHAKTLIQEHNDGVIVPWKIKTITESKYWDVIELKGT